MNVGWVELLLGGSLLIICIVLLYLWRTREKKIEDLKEALSIEESKRAVN